MERNVLKYEYNNGSLYTRRGLQDLGLKTRRIPGRCKFDIGLQIWQITIENNGGYWRTLRPYWSYRGQDMI